MTVSVNGVLRNFVVKPAVPAAPPAKTQTLDVEDQNDHTVSNWGTGNQGDRVTVTLKEQAPGTRSGSDDGAIA